MNYKKIIILLILYSYVFLFINCKKNYDISFDTTEYDFGEVVAESKIEHNFVFKNTGSKMLEIKNVLPTCGCTTASDWDKSVAPGKKGKIPIAFTTPRSNGEQFKVIFIKTNIPDQPRIKLVLKGRTIIPVEIVPYSLWLGDVNNETKFLKGTITITNNLDSPLQIVDIIPPDNKIKYELSTVEKNKKYKLEYTVYPPFEGEKNVNKELIIKTDNKKYEYVTHKFSYFIQ